MCEIGFADSRRRAVQGFDLNVGKNKSFKFNTQSGSTRQTKAEYFSKCLDNFQSLDC